MKSLCTKSIIFLFLALLVVGAAACTQSKPAVPTPTLVPLANETIAPSDNNSTDNNAQPTPIIVNETPGAEATLVTPLGNETAMPPVSGETPIAPTDNGQPTPIVVGEPTLLPTPTTVGDTGQPSAQATPAPGQQPSTGSCSNPYTVQPGEWFYAIARKCGVTPQQLIAANPGMNPNVLRPGQVINMPAGTSGGGSPPPAQATTESGGQPSTGACTNPYTVLRGDTLNAIARKCGTTVQVIMSLNNIPDPSYIFPGQQLRLP
jgi:LysM repeat protein